MQPWPWPPRAAPRARSSLSQRWLPLTALGALLLAAAACTPELPSEHPAPPASRCDGGRTDLPPGLEPAPALALPSSQLRLAVRIPRSRLERALERRIPEKLAAGSRRVSVGRLSYSVQRGPFELGLDGEALLVGVPITIGASVCVPIGPMCPSVGGCSPALRTTVRIPLSLGERYGLGPSQVTTDLTRGCSVAGYDATGQIRSQADRQSAGLQRNIDELLPSIEPEMSALWTALHQPIRLGTDACLVAVPARIAQSPPTLDGEHLALALSIEATLASVAPCAPGGAESAPPLPAPRRAPEPAPAAVVRVPRILPWDALSSQLTQSLSAADAPRFDGRAVRAVTAMGVAAGAGRGDARRAQVALRLELEGSSPHAPCAEAWLVALPTWNGADEPVRLAAVAWLGGASGNADAAPAGELERWLEQQIAIATAPSLAATTAALREVVANAAQRRTTRVTVGEARGEPPSPSVLVAAEGLAPILALPGELPITVR